MGTQGAVSNTCHEVWYKEKASLSIQFRHFAEHIYLIQMSKATQSVPTIWKIQYRKGSGTYGGGKVLNKIFSVAPEQVCDVSFSTTCGKKMSK